jgi:hypothetical protein
MRYKHPVSNNNEGQAPAVHVSERFTLGPINVGMAVIVTHVAPSAGNCSIHVLLVATNHQITLFYFVCGRNVLRVSLRRFTRLPGYPYTFTPDTLVLSVVSVSVVPLIWK